MRLLNTVLAVLALLATTYAPLSYADGDVATMTGIVISLQHFPDDADKEALAAISAGDGSDSVKAVANAIAGINHKVSADDKATLEAIAADDSQPADLRELAGIVAGVNHMPGADAKAKLAELTGR